MKFIAFILAFIVLTLSCMPCADFASTCESTIELKAPHNEEAQHNDICSPFCHCACCSGFSINHSVISVAPVNLFSIKPTSTFLPPSSVEVAFSFWQPPRDC